MSDEIMKKLAALEVRTKTRDRGSEAAALEARQQQSVTGFLGLVDRLKQEHLGEQATRLFLRTEPKGELDPPRHSRSGE